ILAGEVSAAVKTLFGTEDAVVLQPTRREFEGNYTYVFFGLVKSLKRSPAEIGAAIGEYLVNTTTIVSRYNVVQGFLNLRLADSVWLEVFRELKINDRDVRKD